MNWKTTWILLGLAGVLFVFIYFIERHTRPTLAGGEAPSRLIALRPTEVTNLVLRRTNQLVLTAERTQPRWRLTTPLAYPAQTYAIDRLLQALADVQSHAYLSPQELAAQHRTVAEFGLDVPVATLVLRHNGRRTEVAFGSRTAVGDQVYLQLLDSPGIHVVSAEVFDLLPRTPNDWRETSLVSLGELPIDRIEVRTPARGFAIEVNPATKQLTLSKPTPARASAPKVDALLRKLDGAQVSQFVTDDPRADLEAYGLQPPEAELIFGQGTNDLVVVQFGKSPTNDPTAVFARRLSQTNIVLVPKSVLEALQTSHAEMRDRHLLAFAAPAVDTVEVLGAESFSARRQTNGLWLISDPPGAMADPEVMFDLLNRLTFLEGNVEKDVVTDFSAYGLAPPARQYVLKSTTTNAAGAITNRIVGQLSLSPPRDGKVFAHGLDEAVYSITPDDARRLPAAAWQLRDRRVWTFTTNQVARVGIQHRGYSRQLLRQPGGEWSFAPGSQGIINTFAIEEIMYRLGELRAVSWVARGEEERARYGFGDQGHKLAIELKTGTGEKPRVLSLEFADRFAAGTQYPYALANADGQSWIFEFPLPLFYQILNYLSNPPQPAAAARNN